MTLKFHAHHHSSSRRHMLRGGAAAAISLAAAPFMPLQARTVADRTIPQPRPKGQLVSANARVGSFGGALIGPKFLGLSFEKSSLVPRTLSLYNRDLLTALRAIGPGIMRLGGAASDQLAWVPDGSGNVARQISKGDIDDFAPFIKEAGWEVIYGINLAQGSEEAAADEAAYVARRLGDSLVCFEIGNEPNLFRKNYPAPQGAKDWTFDLYRAQWERIRQAISRRVPHAMFSGPDATGGAVESYALPFARSVDKSYMKFLSQHHYRLHADDAPTIEALLVTPDPALTIGLGKRPAMLPALKAAADQLGVPLRFTESNSAVGGGRHGVSDSFASALWSLDFMFTIAKGGGSGVHFHTGRSAAYTPLEFDRSKLVKIRPEYYGLLFFKMIGEGRLLHTQMDAGGANLSIYCVQTQAGISTVLVNKDPQRSFELTLKLPTIVAQARAIALTAPDLSAKTGVQIQGESISVADGLARREPEFSLQTSGQSLSAYVPAGSALLIKTA